MKFLKNLIPPFTFYYLGGKLVAMSENAILRYVHQDHLTGTSAVSDSAGALISSVSYLPFGGARSGSAPTDRLFTGQRLDGTGLYFYNARYYDPEIGRFISADTIVQSLANPQSLNRYSYVLNNPTRYTDPSGHFVFGLDDVIYTLEQGMPVDPDVIAGAIAFETAKGDDPLMAQYMENSDDYFALELNEPDVLTIRSDKSGRTIDFVVAGEHRGLSSDNQYVWSANREDFVSHASSAAEMALIIFGGALLIESASPFEVGGAILKARGLVYPGIICEVVGLAITGYGAVIIVNQVQGKKFPNPNELWNSFRNMIKPNKSQSPTKA